MTTQTLEARTARPDLNDLMPRDTRLTANDIAHRLGVPLDIAWDAIRTAVETGYLDRDEFGTYAPWCRWPRTGI